MMVLLFGGHGGNVRHGGHGRRRGPVVMSPTGVMERSSGGVMVWMMVRVVRVMMMGVQTRHPGHAHPHAHTHARHVIEQIPLTIRTFFGVEKSLGERIVFDLQGGDLK